MQVILTKLDSIHIEDIPNGESELQELKLWPGWTHPKFETILTYQMGADNFALKVIMNRFYAFDALARDISDVINLAGEQVINLYHNNKRVTWHVFSPPKSTNPKLSSGR